MNSNNANATLTNSTLDNILNLTSKILNLNSDNAMNLTTALTSDIASSIANAIGISID